MLRMLGYTFSSKMSPGEEPERSGYRFSDILPEMRESPQLEWLAGERLYAHQIEAIEALEEGKNIILKSGTGSGKTEAWVLYALNKIRKDRGFRIIAVYPTLALSNDQVSRINKYASLLGISVIQLDAPTRDALIKNYGRAGVRTRLASSNILITNPAYLLSELKKYSVRPRSSFLATFLQSPSMIVVDELDFYGPRELALLMGMLEIISLVPSKKPQIVVLTATLSNPTDMGEFLERISGREYRIIEGRPFHVENRLYVVLGKELRRVWEEVKKIKSSIMPDEIDEDILRAMEDYEVFESNPYRVISYLRALGYSIPSVGLDYSEIISGYADDDGVTLVFTRSIARSEEVYKRLAERGLASKAATHHHLVSKELRREIEARAREGDLKIIISPRTLVQGIDIGSIVRIVHLGLPEDVREFIQREGRKGRRKNIPFTESIVIPFGPWDWDLLSKGVKALEKWLSLPLEKTIVNPQNHYMRLLTGLIKLVSPWIKIELDSREKEALELAGVLKSGVLDRRKLKWLWDRMGFYELGPPYGVKRYLVENSFKKPLEPIGYCDLVEYFQVGSIDYSNDSIVTSHNLTLKGRAVTSVVEEPVKRVRFWQNEAFASALEEYIEIKTRWREETNLIADILRGRIYSRVDVAVYPPKRGFGLLTKLPYKVNWIISSERPRIIKMGEKHIVTRNTRVIPLVTPVHGVYRDYTYGYIYEVDEKLDTSLLRLGLALITIYLRRKEALPLDLIEYGIQIVGDKKYVELHESGAAGIIDKLGWHRIKEDLAKYEPDDLDLVLLNQVDQIAYSDFISKQMSWDPVKQYSLMILDYIVREKSILVKIMDEITEIPKPSSANKIIAVDSIAEPLEQGVIEGPLMYLYSLVAYDGEEFKSYTDILLQAPGLRPPFEAKEIENWVLDKAYYEDFVIVVPYRSVAESISVAGLKRLPEHVSGMGIEVTPLISRKYGFPPPIDHLIVAAKSVVEEIKGSPGLEETHRTISRIRNMGYKKLFPREKRIIEGYLKSRTAALYIAYLLSKNIEANKMR